MTDEYFYPNIWGLGVLNAAEDILGEKGVNALLNLAGLSEYIGNYPPAKVVVASVV